MTDQNYQYFDLNCIITFCIPGDGLLFHCNLLHGSCPNDSEMRRWAFNCSFNKKSNNPYKVHHHPQYVKLNKVRFENKQFLHISQNVFNSVSKLYYLLIILPHRNTKSLFKTVIGHLSRYNTFSPSMISKQTTLKSIYQANRCRKHIGKKQLLITHSLNSVV